MKRGIACLVTSWLFGGAVLAATWDEARLALRVAPLSETEAAHLAGLARQRGFQADAAMRWAQVLQQAAAAGVPLGLMVERLAQGLTKEVPAPLLEQGLLRLLDDLQWSRAVADRLVPRAEVRSHPQRLEQALRNTEAALRAGLTRGDVEQILGLGPLTLGQIAALTRTAANLHGAGAGAATVRRLLEGVGAAGVQEDDLGRLDAELATSLAGGVPASEAIRVFEAALGGLVRSGLGVQREQMLRSEIRDAVRSPAAAGELRGPPAGMRGPGGLPGGR